MSSFFLIVPSIRIWTWSIDSLENFVLSPRRNISIYSYKYKVTEKVEWLKNLKFWFSLEHYNNTFTHKQRIL